MTDDQMEPLLQAIGLETWRTSRSSLVARLVDKWPAYAADDLRGLWDIPREDIPLHLAPGNLSPMRALILQARLEGKIP